MSKSLPVLQSTSTQSPTSIPLPELHEGSLSWEEFDCVLADLDDFAEIHDIAGRDSAGTERKLEDIVEAHGLFVAGKLHGLQIHYEFADNQWVDTLLREPNGARLVRMSEQELNSMEDI